MKILRFSFAFCWLRNAMISAYFRYVHARRLIRRWVKKIHLKLSSRIFSARKHTNLISHFLQIRITIGLTWWNKLGIFELKNFSWYRNFPIWGSLQHVNSIQLNLRKNFAKFWTKGEKKSKINLYPKFNSKFWSFHSSLVPKCSEIEKKFLRRVEKVTKSKIC